MPLPPSGIYKITNLKNNKVYIGQSKNIYKRKTQHLVALSKGRHPNQPMQKEYKAQKGHYFRWDVVEYCSLDKLNEREQYWIQKYNSFVPNGYNQGWQPYKRKVITSKKKKKNN